jgi:hypothetical protein
MSSERWSSTKMSYLSAALRALSSVRAARLRKERNFSLCCSAFRSASDRIVGSD